MYYRLDTDTDIATLGIWDATASAPERVLRDKNRKTQRAAWEEDVAAARLFILESDSDGSYAAEFYIDEAVPEEKLRQARTVNREHLLRCEGGALVAGGLEDFRSPKRQITDASSRITVPPGAYRLRLHVGETEGQVNEADLITLIGAEDYAYYQKVGSRQSLGCLGAFLAFLPAALLGANFAVFLVCALVFGGIGYFLAGMMVSMNDRYQRIRKKVEEYHAKVPGLIFELTRIGEAEAAQLSGGRLRL